MPPYVEDPCICDHTKNTHIYNKETQQYERCDAMLGYSGQETCMCPKYEPRPPRKARFDLNGLVLDTK